MAVGAAQRAEFGGQRADACADRAAGDCGLAPDRRLRAPGFGGNALLDIVQLRLGVDHVRMAGAVEARQFGHALAEQCLLALQLAEQRRRSEQRGRSAHPAGARGTLRTGGSRLSERAGQARIHGGVHLFGARGEQIIRTAIIDHRLIREVHAFTQLLNPLAEAGNLRLIGIVLLDHLPLDIGFGQPVCEQRSLIGVLRFRRDAYQMRLLHTFDRDPIHQPRGDGFHLGLIARLLNILRAHPTGIFGVAAILVGPHQRDHTPYDPGIFIAAHSEFGILGQPHVTRDTPGQRARLQQFHPRRDPELFIGFRDDRGARLRDRIAGGFDQHHRRRFVDGRRHH